MKADTAPHHLWTSAVVPPRLPAGSLLNKALLSYLYRKPASELRRRALRPGRFSRLPIVAALYQQATGRRLSAPAYRTAAAMLRGYLVHEEDLEGRAQSLVLAAAWTALSGVPVHVLSLSDTRSRALHAAAQETFELLGLDCAVLPDDAGWDDRLTGYSASVLFASAGRLAQDVLREQVGRQGRSFGLRSAVARLGSRATEAFHSCLPRTSVALLEDANLVLLEAPRLVRLAEDEDEEAGRAYADQAFAILACLERDVHYTIDRHTRRIQLTSDGRERLDTNRMLFGGAWLMEDWAEETVLAAIAIRDLYRMQTDYLVDQGKLVIKHETGAVANAPSIRDLISAKENLPGRRGALHAWDTRKLFRTYARISGVGVSLAPYRQELRRYYNLRLKLGSMEASHPPSPALYRDRQQLLSALEHLDASAGETVVWAPTPADAADLCGPLADMEVVVGDTVFRDPPSAMVIIQTGAAQASSEMLLRQLCPDAQIRAVASPDDGIFDVVDEDHPAIVSLRRSAMVPDYRAAQRAYTDAAIRRRIANYRSEQFFERILGFVEEKQY